jgi:hypothetical protein
MQDLRLVGVHEDGEHLLLGGEGGESYRLAIDEALRSAAARPSVRVPAANSSESGAAMSPREIQARIRAGASAEEVAAESGVSMERVLRYEGPVRAERDYMAEQAQLVEVAAALPSHDGYRSGQADQPATLGAMVLHRLPAFGIDPDTLVWDSWRRADGTWEVLAQFSLPAEATGTVGEEPPARWIYDHSRRTIRNTSRWAQQLSEIEPLDGPVPGRRLTAVADRVFDFETDAEPEAEAQDASAEAQEDADPDNLLEVLRSRRGQRLGVDEDADDALALMLSRGGVPAAHPRDSLSDESQTGADDGEDHPSKGLPFGLSLAPAYDDGGDGPLDLPEGVSTDTREITVSGAPARPKDESATGAASAAPARSGHEEPEDNDGKEGAVAEADPQPKRSLRPKRSSVPSWDEIVFGTRHE